MNFYQNKHLHQLILTLAFFGTVTGRYHCTAKDFIRLGNSCYHLSTEIASWQEAHFSCRDRNAQLAVLGTQHEDATLRHYLERPEFASTNRWIGGINLPGGEERKWIWAAQGNDIENVRGFANTRVLNIQDNNTWMCLLMDANNRYRWSNENCIYMLHYICEAPLVKIDEDDSSATTTTTTSTTEEPYGEIDLYDDEEDEDNDSEDDSESW